MVEEEPGDLSKKDGLGENSGLRCESNGEKKKGFNREGRKLPKDKENVGGKREENQQRKCREREENTTASEKRYAITLSTFKSVVGDRKKAETGEQEKNFSAPRGGVSEKKNKIKKRAKEEEDRERHHNNLRGSKERATDHAR